MTDQVEIIRLRAHVIRMHEKVSREGEGEREGREREGREREGRGGEGRRWRGEGCMREI